MKQKGLLLIGIAVAGLTLAAGSSVYAFSGGGFGGRNHGCGMSHWRGGHGEGWIKRADVDKDGVISLDEALAMRGGRFERFDTDKSGEVSAKEIETAVNERVEDITRRIVHRFDQNRDGKVTRDEYDRFAKERFSWMDLNDDGKIEKDELPGFKQHKRDN